MNHDNARLARLAARIKSSSPRFVEQARGYMSVVSETLSSAPVSAYPELRRWIKRDAPRRPHKR